MDPGPEEAGVFLCYVVEPELFFAPYRLLFNEPFGTAHGTRNGTDTVFVRLEHQDQTGHGEATTPPYVKEQRKDVVEALHQIDPLELMKGNFQLDPVRSPAARAAVTMAYYDLISKVKKVSIGDLLQLKKGPAKQPYHLITLGLMEISRIPSKLLELPGFNALKVKLDGLDDLERLKVIMAGDERPMLLDANQGWRSLDHALRVIDLIGPKCLLGLEQPFPVDRPDLQDSLAARELVPVYADESMQRLEDLDRLAGSFTGINIKLMKCGGLDVALAMAQKATDLNMKVMLGSMSESSLGCGAMLHLEPFADLVDLDGPWLIGNDPFESIVLRHGRITLAGHAGAAARSTLYPLLNWTPIGA